MSELVEDTFLRTLVTSTSSVTRNPPEPEQFDRLIVSPVEGDAGSVKIPIDSFDSVNGNTLVT